MFKQARRVQSIPEKTGTTETQRDVSRNLDNYSGYESPGMVRGGGET